MPDYCHVLVVFTRWRTVATYTRPMKYRIFAGQFRSVTMAFIIVFLMHLTGVSSAVADEWREPPAAATPSAAEFSRLQAGEVLVSKTQVDKAGGAAIAQAIFYIDASELWRVLSDCTANYRFVRGLKDCEILSETATSAVTRQVLKPYLLLPRFEYVFETRREPYEWIVIRLRDGDLRVLEGSWRFDPLPGDGGILVTHAIRIQPQMRVPRWLARRTVERDLGRLFACLRWETRAWPGPEQGKIDRDQCPAR